MPPAPFLPSALLAAQCARPPAAREPLKYVAQLRYLRRRRRERAAAAATAAAKPRGRPQGGAAGGVDGQGAKQPRRGPGEGDDRHILLLVDMAAGHFAASGAGERLRQRAEKVAFIIDALGRDALDAATSGTG
jgi:hypothetical protein